MQSSKSFYDLRQIGKDWLIAISKEDETDLIDVILRIAI